MLGNGLGATLIGLRASLEGFSTAATGTVMSGYYVGFLIGSLAVPGLVGRVGHIRAYAGLASLASTATLGHLVFTEPAAWFVFRVVTGTCLAGLYIVAESWLNGASSDATRGRILAVYMVISTGGLAIGQLLLTLSDPGGFVLFLVGAILFSLAVVPVSFVRFPAPEIPAGGPIPYRHILNTAPIGLAGALIVGAANGAVLGMGAVWGAAAGLSVHRIAIVLMLALVGGVAFQWPLGALSDRVSRRRVIFSVTVLAAGAALWLAALEPAGTPALIAVFVLGGFSFPMYSLSGSHVNDLVGRDHVVGASSAILLANGIGAVTGPVGASLVMTALGPAGLWFFVALVHAALGVYAAVRLIKRWHLPAPDKDKFIPFPVRSGGSRSWVRKD